MITIPNERLLAIIDRHTSLNDSFMTADDVLRQAIQGISDLILVPGLINLDFADVKTIMAGMGLAMMGTGIAEGENRAMLAAQKAISSPLLEGASVEGARGVIINVTGGPDLSLLEVSEASTIIQEAAHEDANIIFGAVVDEALTGRVKITVIATGFDRGGATRAPAANTTQTPVDLSHYSVKARTPDPVSVSMSARTSHHAAGQALDLPQPMPMAVGARGSGDRGLRRGVAARRAGVHAAAARGLAPPAPAAAEHVVAPVRA